MEPISVDRLETLPLKQGLEERRDLRSDGLTGREVLLERLDGGGDVVDGGCARDGEDASEPGANVEAASEKGGQRSARWEEKEETDSAREIWSPTR